MGLLSGHLNVFRILGDLSHVSSKVILIWAIHANRSAEGVSLITQIFYIAVFLSRYMDLFWTPVFVSKSSPYADQRFLLIYNFFGKVFYVTTSVYVVFVMMRVYARTREREKAWRLGLYCLLVSAVLATPVAAMFQSFPKENPYGFRFSQIVWTFSIILESVCVIPQLLLLRQTTVPTVIDSYYLLALGSYRGFYILNWIVRLAGKTHHFDPISVIFGIIQTALYVDFAYVYYTRQRVKLRNGGVVDSDDLRQGLLVRRFLGKGGRQSFDEEDGAEAADEGQAESGRSWGPRGISVSADDGVHENGNGNGKKREEEQGLTDPQAFEDDDFDDDPDLGPEEAGNGHVQGVGNGSEWRDNNRK
ncbi:hypothetical protein NA57DRAFT_47891 [Rhizodiscina lignyota]|uniref:ER lumen protein retaining receptor n=1 Tax=Rhizodiscina lignyota TaxID=1504668 RepID=A0A9P4I2D1_9PEZI|nr:hypothetical protein NA57DRAFT_47891 [Rhizodiscina lignyota]